MSNKNFRVKNGLDIGTAISITDAGVVTGLTTTNLPEGTNEYFTTTKARNSVSGGTGVIYTSATGVVAIGQAVATTDTPTFAGATLGNVTIGVTTDNTITTSSGGLVLKSTSGEIDTDTTNVLSTNSATFALLNSPTTVNAFQGATALTMGAATGTSTIRNDLTVSGNLTVNGTTTTLNTETLAVEDNIVILNSNVTAAPSTNAGIEIERGTSTNAALTWNETSDKWEQNRAGTSTVLPINTSELAELTNLYYTDVRARASLSGTAPIGYDNSTGAITFVPTPTTGSLLGGNGTTWIDSITGITGQYTLNRNAPGATGNNNILVLTKTRTDGARNNGQGPIEVFNYTGTDGGYNFARLQVGYQSGGAHSYNFQTSTDTSGAFSTGTSTPLTFSRAAATFTIENGLLTTNRTGSVAAQSPAQLLRYIRTDQTGPQDSDGVDFRLSVGGTATNTNFARFDGIYKAAGDNEIGMSVSTDSFTADTDRIYIGSRANTQIRNTPAGGGTTNTTAEFTQLATTIKSDSVVLQTAAGVSLPSGKITYSRQYGNFLSSATQTNPVANAQNLMVFGTTDIANGVSIVTNGTALTRITMSTACLYDMQFSAQIAKTGAGNDNCYIWLKKNGTTVTQTAGITRVSGNGDRIMASWNYLVNAAAGDYYEIAWSATDTDVILQASSPGGIVPAVPSVILSVVPVGA